MKRETAAARRDRLVSALELAKADHRATAGTLTDWQFMQSLSDAIDDVRECFDTRRAAECEESCA